MHTKLTLGERLKDLRIEQGYTLEELAAQTAYQKRPLASMKPTSQETLACLPSPSWRPSTR